MRFKWEKGGYRPVVKDGEGEVIAVPNDADEELIEMIKEMKKNMKCELKSAAEPVFMDEPRFEDKGRVELKWSLASCVDDFINILLINGYQVSVTLKKDLNNKIPIGRDYESIAIIEFEKEVE